MVLSLHDFCTPSCGFFADFHKIKVQFEHFPKITSSPAAYDTIARHLKNTGQKPADFDLIITGDLGAIGKEIVMDLFAKDGVDMVPYYDDCGVLIYDADRQDVHAGGSGCGCSAVVLCGYLLKKMEEGALKRLLFCGTGALLSTTSTMQGESIPAICHAVSLEREV